MKKTLLSLIAMLFLVGCSTPTSKVEKTPEIMIVQEETFEPTSNPNVGYVEGVWEGNTFQSTTLGFKLEIPENWNCETDELKQAALEVGMDYLGEDEIAQSSIVNEFIITSPKKDISIQCASSYIGPMAKILSITMLTESIKGQLGKLESIVYMVEDEGTTTLAGQEFGFLVLSEQTTGMEQTMYFRIVGEYMNTMTATANAGRIDQGNAVIQSITAIE